MKTRISRFVAATVLLGTLSFGTATQAQYGGGGDSRSGDYNKKYGQYGGGRNFVALTSNNVLVRGNKSGQSPINVTGTNENLLGIDYRPANGMLYGITSTKVYTINVGTGVATEVSTLSLNNQPIALKVGQESGVDFNPVVDRLRVVGSNDQNFRINVDTGVVLMDGNINYAAGDRHAGQNPSLTAAAYTNSFAGGPDPKRTTSLYDIDFDRDVLTLQNPPNNGTLQTIGSLNVDFERTAGFNISGRNDALAVSNSTLYEIDLRSGSARAVAKLPSDQYIGLSVSISADRNR